MNAAYIHLVLNHLPLVGLLFSLSLLAVSLFFQKTSPALTTAALVCVVVSSLFLVPTFLSGEGAEEVVEHLPRVSEGLIHDHEERAEAGLVVGLLAGAFALGTLVLRRYKPQFARPGQWVTLAVGAVALVVLGFVAQSGGRIAHPEAHGTVATTNQTEPDGNRLSHSAEQSEHDEESEDDD
jgi:H+/Cl- antiporter ClcA